MRVTKLKVSVKPLVRQTFKTTPWSSLRMIFTLQIHLLSGQNIPTLLLPWFSLLLVILCSKVTCQSLSEIMLYCSLLVEDLHSLTELQYDVFEYL